MKDSVFKKLKHPLEAGWTIASSGGEVAPGYKPDITIVDPVGTLRFILESEQKTDRKAYLGDLIKAEMYSENKRASPELIIVMKTATNTTTAQIYNHLLPYAQWVANIKGGNLNLSAIHVLSDIEYLAAIAANQMLGSAAFQAHGHRLVKIINSHAPHTQEKFCASWLLSR